MMKREQENHEHLIEIKPAGIIKNANNHLFQINDWQERAGRMKTHRESLSEIIIDDELNDALDGIEDFSHLMIIYWAHLTEDKKHSVRKVHPMGNSEFPLVGVFATHSPARPNGLLVSIVELIERKGNVLTVTGLDALDGSPVLDIKPYSGENIDLKSIKVPDWMEKIHDTFKDEHSSE